ncbi:predicted protein [Botrytis cinerea T4]|uniref:Uncharacterized protein n=1 Tax=Botryotinia fuckeliana (strain T4) TaxID=999810 RepID=G2YKK7_BOTF4|nr:predicted protein [Botrytis cinerea T4]
MVPDEPTPTHASPISSREARKSVSQAPPLVTSMTVNTNILFDAETTLLSDFI